MAQISTFERIKSLNEGLPTVGRPPSDLCNEETAARILKNLAAGSYVMTACEAAGVSYHTVRSWLRKAADAKERGDFESPYVKFAQAVTHAEASAEQALVTRLNVAEDWRAQAFLLERRHRNRWGKAESQKQETQVLVISDQLAEGMLEALRVAAESRLREPQQQQQTIEAEATSSEEAEPEES